MWNVTREVIRFCSSNWPVLLFLMTIIGLLVGRIVYGISPFYWLIEIGHKQHEYRREAEQEQYKRRMVKRHIELGDMLLDVSEVEAAKVDYERALTLDPMNVGAQMGILKCEIFLEVTKKDYSPQVNERRLKLVQAENPNDKHALLFLGDVYSAIDPTRALETYQEALRQDPNLATAYHHIGLIYEQQAQFDKAAENYEKAAELAGWNSHILANVAYHYLRKNQYADAIRQFEMVLRLDPKLLWAYLSLTHAYWSMEDLDNAYAYEQSLMQLLDDEEVTSLPLNRGLLLFDIGNERIYIANLPQLRCYSYYTMALTFYLLGNTEQSDAFVQKARDSKVDDQSPSERFIKANISELLTEASTFSGALEDFTKRYFDGAGNPHLITRRTENKTAE